MENKPRHSCKRFFDGKGLTAVVLSREKFDDLCRDKKFREGPFKESFGYGYGEPYNPDKQAFGILKDGRGVYCELNLEDTGNGKNT